MKDSLQIALLQLDSTWHDPAANRRQIEAYLPDLKTSPDLIILPEMFTSGFTMQPELVAEPMDGETVQWMSKHAMAQKSHFMGSIVIEEGGSYYNRFIHADPEGGLSYYDKKHLFTLAKEANHYQPGNQLVLMDCKGWRIAPMICYDLRFPVWSRNVADYDLLVYVANFPATRTYAWDQLLIARAIENQCYVCGVNRIGVDGVNVPYEGHSAVINFDGQVFNQRNNAPGWIEYQLPRDPMQIYRRAYPFLRDRDPFEFVK